MEENNEIKHRKRTLIIMIILIALFVIGIIVRWDYISGEITESVQHMFKGK